MVRRKPFSKIKEEKVAEINFLNPEMSHLRIFVCEVMRTKTAYNEEKAFEYYIIQKGKKPVKTKASDVLKDSLRNKIKIIKEKDLNLSLSNVEDGAFC